MLSLESGITILNNNLNDLIVSIKLFLMILNLYINFRITK